jgi:cell filamentation protein
VTDPYVDPSTGVLKNKLGLTEKEALRLAEVQITTVRDIEMAIKPLPGVYDLKHLCAFHRRLFGDVYAWAGKPRTVDIAKGSTKFCLAMHLESYASNTVFPMIKDHDYLRGLDQGQTVQTLAALLAEVNVLHPFRDGNGRTQRAFFRQMAAAAGWHIDWAAADPHENVKACAEAWAGSNGPLEQMLTPLVAPMTST